MNTARNFRRQALLPSSPPSLSNQAVCALLEQLSLSALTHMVTQALGNLTLQPWSTSEPQSQSSCSS